MRKLFLILMTLMACTWSLSAQTRTYHGTVVDGANNEPLIGATIMPLGGGQGVATDVEGKFTLNVPANVRQVKVSYVGYTSQTVNVQNNMVIHLHSTSSNLDDVVVVAYGTANKESLTGSVAVVGSKEIEDRPVTSVTAALEGNAPGVQVNNSVGNPGTSPSIRIRGFNSINGSNTPLYVVDGVVYEGSIADLNPADIESMSVLKDAASSALYGNRGANGVILITTKKAKNVGKVDVTLQVRQGMYNRGLPFYDRMGANQWMEAMLNGYANGLATITTSFPDYNTAAEYARENLIDDVILNNIYDAPNNKLFNSENKLVANMLPGYNDLDWWDAISQNGYRQEYNVNASAATEKFNIFSSVGYLKENGYILNTDFERFNARFNANYQPVSYFKMGVNVYAAHQESEQGQADPDNLGLVSNPFNVINTAPVYPYYLHDATGAVVYDPATGEPVWNTEQYNKGSNVAWTMRLDKKNYASTTIDGSIYGTAIIPYGFELTLRGSMYRRKQTASEYMNNTAGSQAGIGLLSQDFGTYKSHTFMQQLTWNQDYGKNHVDVLLDHENYQYGYDLGNMVKRGQILPDILAFPNFDTYYSDNQQIRMRRTESYLGRARYNWDQKYFAEASVRRDGTSRFAKDKRWGTFWSVGASWIITKEKFMQSLNWVNFLKLRAAYGSVGNDASAGTYAYWALYGFNSPMNSNGTITPTQLATPDIKWEATKTFDIALEGSLFDDRFNFSIGYFNKRNTDLLFNVTLPSSVGTLGNDGYNPSILSNIGTMQNIGWELAFGVDIIRNKDVKWNFNIDATFMKNKIIKLPKNQDMASAALFMGKSLYEKYTYEWAGVDQLTGRSLYDMAPDSPDYYSYDSEGNKVYNEALWNSNVANASKAGELVEINGKYYTTNTSYARRKVMGTALPTVYGSFGTNFSWKGINLGLLFTYSLGGKSSNSVYQSLMSVSSDSPAALHTDLAKAWTAAPAGMTEDSPNRIDPNGVPQLNTEYSQYDNAMSSRFLISNNYLTLKNLMVSYDFPSKWVSAMKMQNLNLGFSVDNLFIITRQKGFNPQYSFGGGQGDYYVPARVFSFQLSVKF